MIASRLSALALAAALGWSAAAQAQQPPAPPAGAHDWSPEARQHMREQFEARHAEHVKALHDLLNIHPDQEAAFQAFIAARKPEHGQWGGKPGEARPGEGRPGEGRPDHDQFAALTTPERLERMEHKLDEHAQRRHEAFERRAAATKAFYAVLTPEQKRAFDALPALIGHGHDHGDHHGGPEGGHGPHGGPEGPGQG